MKLAVFGGTGGTGRRLTEQAVGSGHEVRALARSSSGLPSHDQVTAVEGDVLEPESVARTLEDADAAVCLLGRTPDNPEDVVSRGTANIVEEMADIGVARLVVVTSMGLGSSVENLPWYVRVANATVLHNLMADKARQEELVMGSELDWTVVRPGGLTDEPGTGEYVHGVDIDTGAGPISRADVADFLLTTVLEDVYLRQPVTVTTEEGPSLRFIWRQTAEVSRRLLGRR